MGVIDSKFVKVADPPPENFLRGERYESRAFRIGPLLRARDMGYHFGIVPLRKRGYPFHNHCGEEEMFFIVRGRGALRYGDEHRPIRAGDMICYPTGGPETAHQIINDFDEDLAYLSVSTKIPGEVCEYPDSKKIMACGGDLRP